MLFCRRVTTWDKFFRDLVDLPNLFVQQNITGWPSIFDKHFLFLVWRNFLRQTVFLRQTILKKYIDWWPQAMIMRFLCRHFSSKRAFCRIPSILQRLTAPRIIDQFGHKSYQKKRKSVGYTGYSLLRKNILLKMNCSLSKIRSLHISLTEWFILNGIVQKPKQVIFFM